MLCCDEFTGFFFFFQAEGGKRKLVRSRELGNVYKKKSLLPAPTEWVEGGGVVRIRATRHFSEFGRLAGCLLYTLDAADE